MKERQPIYDHPAMQGAKIDGLPRHAAVIPDGNDTWAKVNEVSRHEGHAKGANALVTISRDLRQLDELDAFSVWSISEKNFDKRPSDELGNIQDLIAHGLRDPENTDDFMSSGTRFVHLGRRTRLTPDLLDAIRYVEDLTAENSRHTLALLIDYGGDFELETIIEQSKELALDDLRSTKDLTRILPAYRKLPPLDVLIRSKSKSDRVALSDLGPIVGEAFIYPLEKLWPDVTTGDILEKFVDFSNTERNFGGRSENK